MGKCADNVDGYFPSSFHHNLKITESEGGKD